MSRTRPPDRLQRLVHCATEVFIERGYRRAQMEDVAAALGVSKGTVYLYVESKEALFDLVCRALAHGEGFAFPTELPVPTPSAGDTFGLVAGHVASRQRMSQLLAALDRRRVTDIRSELTGIFTELHDTLAANRRAIKLVDRVAADDPELGELWFKGAREGVVGLLAEYLTDRARRGHVRRSLDPRIHARLCLETLSFWAVHRHWDPHPQAMDDAVARTEAIAFVVGATLHQHESGS